MRKLRILLIFIFIGAGIYFVSTLASSPSYQDAVDITSVAPLPSTLASNRYTQMETEEDPVTNPYVSLDDHELLGGMNGLEFYFSSTYLSFRIVEVETGYIWSSSTDVDYRDPESPLYDENDFGYNDAWFRRFMSPIFVNYIQGATVTEEYLFQSTASNFTYTILTGERIGFQADVHFAISNVQMRLLVYLDESGLNVEVPFEYIEEGELRLLSSISVYRFFGATKRARTPGYVFIPDGVGALIRFDDDPARSEYSKRFYGPDYAISTSVNFPSEEMLYANVYGIAQGVNQNAFLAIVKEGAANATLISRPSRVQTDFNYTFVQYAYRTIYTQYLNQSRTSSVNRVQQQKSEFDVHINYQFLTGDSANYVGMANQYRSYLIDRYGMTQNEIDQDISLHLDVLAAENESALIGRRTFSMTTTNQLDAMLTELLDDVARIQVSYYGWNRGGYSYTHPNYRQVESKVGSRRDFLDLNAKYGDSDRVQIYYNTIYNFASASAGGYNSSHIAQTIGIQLLQTGSDYLLKPNYGLSKYQSDFTHLQRFGIENIAFETLGNILYSEYSSGIISRSQMIEVMEAYLEVSNKTAVARPFNYLWHADVLYDIPLYNSQQRRFTDTVPFIPIVLSGYSEVYGRSGNFFSNTSNELLRMIDYNIYPSFYLTHESAYLLLDTGSENIFTSRYADWYDEILRQYDYVNSALKHVINQTITSREVLDTGVVLVTYSNNVQIYINYSGSDYTDGAITVEGLSYQVVGI